MILLSCLSITSLLKAHFDAEQFEPANGSAKPRLKRSAVPTLFKHRRTPSSRKPPAIRTTNPPAFNREPLLEHTYNDTNTANFKNGKSIFTLTKNYY